MQYNPITCITCSVTCSLHAAQSYYMLHYMPTTRSLINYMPLHAAPSYYMLHYMPTTWSITWFFCMRLHAAPFHYTLFVISTPTGGWMLGQEVTIIFSLTKWSEFYLWHSPWRCLLRHRTLRQLKNHAQWTGLLIQHYWAVETAAAQAKASISYQMSFQFIKTIPGIFWQGKASFWGFGAATGVPQHHAYDSPRFAQYLAKKTAVQAAIPLDNPHSLWAL